MICLAPYPTSSRSPAFSSTQFKKTTLRAIPLFTGSTPPVAKTSTQSKYQMPKLNQLLMMTNFLKKSSLTQVGFAQTLIASWYTTIHTCLIQVRTLSWWSTNATSHKTSIPKRVWHPTLPRSASMQSKQVCTPKTSVSIIKSLRAASIQLTTQTMARWTWSSRDALRRTSIWTRACQWSSLLLKTSSASLTPGLSTSETSPSLSKTT